MTASMAVIVDWHASRGAVKTWAFREGPKMTLLRIFMLEISTFEGDV